MYVSAPPHNKRLQRATSSYSLGALYHPDLSGRITLGEGSAVVRDVINDLVGKGNKKILLNLVEVNFPSSNTAQRSHASRVHGTPCNR